MSSAPRSSRSWRDDLRELDAGGRRTAWLLILTLLTSGVVIVEPAPFDLLAAAFLPFAFLVGRPAVHPRLVLPLAGMGLTIFTTIISVLLVEQPLSTLRFLAISLYLFALWGTLTMLVTRHGRPFTRLALVSYSLGVVSAGSVAILISATVPALSDFVAPWGRLQGFFKDANVFGGALVPALVFSLHAAGQQKGRARLAWLGVTASAAIGVLFCYSRGAWVNALVCLVAMYSLRALGSRGRANLRTLTGFIVAMALLGPVLWKVTQLPAVQEMLDIRFRYQHYDNDRFGTQLDALLAAAEHPLGIGPGMSERTFDRATHSLYVRALIEGGPVGFIAMMTVLLASLARASWLALVARDPRLRGLMAVIAGLLWGVTAESFVIDTLHWRHFWLFLALAWTAEGTRPPAQSSQASKV